MLNDLINTLRTKGVLHSARIQKALETVDRINFVGEENKRLAYIDEPLPISEGQTISQPYTVVFMLELLQPKRGEKIMDVGAGSGWQTGLLAQIVGPRGKVYAIELVPSLCEFAKKNITQFPELNKRVEFFSQNANAGLPNIADGIGGFDAIIAAAEVQEVPKAWRQQLKTGGRLLYPKSSELCLEVKTKKGAFHTQSYPGFAFVPFID